jgi:predicted acylesterase/phospholipase RssA
MTTHLWLAAEEEARHALMPRIARTCRELAENPDTTNLLFGAMSPEPLRRRLEKLLPDAFPADGPVVYASALKCGKEREVRAFCLNDLDRKTRVDALCASAAIPVAFPPVEIDGALWQDGGWAERGGEGTPLSPILANHPEIKTVVVVYLNDDRHLPLGLRARIRRRAETAGKRLIEIVPSRNIGGPFNGWFGVFDSSPETRRDLIAWGYDDAKKAFAGLNAR